MIAFLIALAIVLMLHQWGYPWLREKIAWYRRPKCLRKGHDWGAPRHPDTLPSVIADACQHFIWQDCNREGCMFTKVTLLQGKGAKDPVARFIKPAEGELIQKGTLMYHVMQSILDMHAKYEANLAIGRVPDPSELARHETGRTGATPK